jgi:uncharacterized protein (TIGR00290 family)
MRRVTDMKEKVMLAWSGGKDSALALYEILQNENYEVAALLTTVTSDYDRISMHGVRRSLLEMQAESLGLALEKVFITAKTSNEQYEAAMRELLTKYKNAGVSTVVFGDIFLEDLKKYREGNLAKIGMKGLFPLWKKDTAKLARTFIDLGFKTIIACVDTNFLDKIFVGRTFNKEFLAELPANIDPCGENGEFHSFVYDGPIFKKRIAHDIGEVVLRENRFYYCDLIPYD